jgi:hypothetical protein
MEMVGATGHGGGDIKLVWVFLVISCDLLSEAPGVFFISAGNEYGGEGGQAAADPRP